RPGTRLSGITRQRIGQRHGQPRRLPLVQTFRRLLEVEPRGRLDAENAWAPLGDVEINLHDPAFRPDQLQDIGQRQLNRLAQETLGRPEEQVFDDLHRNRTGATHLAASGVFDRVLDGLEIYAVVLAK